MVRRDMAPSAFPAWPLSRPANTQKRVYGHPTPNFRDVTAMRVGTVIGIVGAAAAKATKPG
jgi:hypothetical protein